MQLAVDSGSKIVHRITVRHFLVFLADELHACCDVAAFDVAGGDKLPSARVLGDTTTPDTWRAHYLIVLLIFITIIMTLRFQKKRRAQKFRGKKKGGGRGSREFPIFDSCFSFPPSPPLHLFFCFFQAAGQVFSNTQQ